MPTELPRRWWYWAGWMPASRVTVWSVGILGRELPLGLAKMCTFVKSLCQAGSGGYDSWNACRASTWGKCTLVPIEEVPGLWWRWAGTLPASFGQLGVPGGLAPGVGKNVHFREVQARQEVQGPRPRKRLWHKQLGKVHIRSRSLAGEARLSGRTLARDTCGRGKRSLPGVDSTHEEIRSHPLANPRHLS